jgi:hypothetical protein
VRFGSTGHVAAPDLTLSRRRGLELRDTWQRRSSPQQGDEVRRRGTHGGAGAHLCREVWSEATAYVAALDAHTAPCLDLELVCNGTQSSGYQQRPLGPPQERLRTHRWGQLELKIREHPPSTLRNVDSGPQEVLAIGPAMATTEAEYIDGGAPTGCWRHVRQRPPLKLKM